MAALGDPDPTVVKMLLKHGQPPVELVRKHLETLTALPSTQSKTVKMQALLPLTTEDDRSKMLVQEVSSATSTIPSSPSSDRVPTSLPGPSSSESSADNLGHSETQAATYPSESSTSDPALQEIGAGVVASIAFNQSDALDEESAYTNAVKLFFDRLAADNFVSRCNADHQQG